MLQRKKRLYYAVMIIGALALLIDQFVFKADARGEQPPYPPLAKGGSGELSHVSQGGVGGVSSRANGRRLESIDSSTGASVTASTSVEITGAPIPELPFPRSIRSWDPQLPMRDVFEPPVLQAGPDAPADASAHGPPGAADSDRLKRLGRVTFRAQHKLQGVAAYRRLKIAIVDDTWLQVGDTLDGCRLTTVYGTKARFICHDGEAILALAGGQTWSRN